MRIALGLPSRVAAASGEMMLDWATRADRGPFPAWSSPIASSPRRSSRLSVLAMAAGATRRIRLMTSVVIGPTRETTLLARQAATIDVISNGRLTLGIGIGVRENDYLATGLDFHRRGRRIEEQLPILRRLWAGEPLSNEMGPIGPQSPRPGGPELLIGGYVPAIVRAHRQMGRRLHGAGRRRAGEHAQDVAADPASMASQRAQRPAALGRRQLLCARDRTPLDHATRYINHNYGYNPELAAKRLRTLPASRDAVEECDQAPSRHGRGRIHPASVRGGFRPDGALGGSRGAIQLSTPDRGSTTSCQAPR